VARWLTGGIWLLASVLCTGAWASENENDYLDLLNRARKQDPEFRAALAARDAGMESRSAGRALLRPSFALTYEYGNSGTAREYSNGAPPVDYSANSSSTTLRASQPLFNLERWSTWRAEDKRALLSELRLQESSVELTLRVLRTIFDWQLAKESWLLAKTQYETMVQQRKEAESLRKAGALAVTDVEDTRAREMSTKSSELEAQYSLELRRRDMVRLFGVFNLEGVVSLNAQALTAVEPDRLDWWLDRARVASPKVLSSGLALQIAGHSVDTAKGGFAPSADLVASVTRTHNPNSYTTLERSGGVSVRVNIPLYEGGKTSSSVRKAEALQLQATQELEKSLQEAQAKIEEAFLGVANSIERTKAMAQGVIAATTALQGALIGRKAGLRTQSEVLNAEQQLYAIQRDLSRQKYTQALALVQLKALAGELKEDDLLQIGSKERR
jgi:outer membrane protein